MFKKFAMVDEFIRRSMRPKPVIPVPQDGLNEEEQTQSLSHLGQTARISGDVTLNENLCIDGEIEGTITIRGKRLNISDRALVKGEVHARTVSVRGSVQGDVHGEDLVHLYSAAVVTGNVHCKRVIIDDGAQFDGCLKTSRDTVKTVEVKNKTEPTGLKEAPKTEDAKPKLKSVSG